MEVHCASSVNDFVTCRNTSFFKCKFFPRPKVKTDLLLEMGKVTIFSDPKDQDQITIMILKIMI